MNIRDLTYLVAIADHCHFGKAAEVCFVSQPALSMQIKKLETILGVQLIERTNKTVFLTDVGKLIIEQARDVLLRVEGMKAVAKQAKDPFNGEIQIGIIPTLAPYLLPQIMPGLSSQFPNLKIFLTEERTEHLRTKLKHGRLDAAIFGLPLQDDFDALPLFEEELVLAIPANHPLTKQKVIHHQDLEKKVLLLLEDGHCLRDQVLALCQAVNAYADKSFQATSLETLRYMVASQAGITLMPKLSMNSTAGICYLPFKSPKPTRMIGMIWRPSSAKTILLKEMVCQIRKLLSRQQAVKVIQTAIPCQKTFGTE